MIHVDDVRKVVESYLERFPSERARQADLLESLDAQRSVTSRKTFTGHVTCSATQHDWLTLEHVDPQVLRDKLLRRLS